jgi:ATP-binding cassette subfamily F protein 3
MLVNGSSLGMRFGAEDIFDDVSFTINRGDRAALVGVNGAGKTTLIRLITGELEPTSGDLRISSATRLAHLPQQMSGFPRGPLQDAVCREAGEAARAIRRMNRIHADLETASDGERKKQLLESLADAHDLADSTDAFRLRSNSEKVLAGLGFTKEDLSKPLEEFSGGWRMRAQLASLLLSDPDVLLLDEPTNHLDLDARIWLEEYLTRFGGAVWIISHDPGFLDRIVDRVHELEFGSLTAYSGNYTFYENMKREEISRREKQARHQAEQMEKVQRFIKRFKATESKRFQVRSRETMLERIEIIQTHRDPRHIRLRFPDPPRSGEIVARLENVGKEYDRPVFSDVDLVINRGDRIGIVGRNGEGKSTLSRILAGVESPSSGCFRQGSGVETGFYTQEVDQGLNPELNLLEQLSLVSPVSGEKELRSILGGFLFTGDDVFKSTGVLSGGEKSRLALARILLSPVNFLILDEPTNHLDLFSRKVLSEALEEYSGTLVLISHDEQLLSALVEKVYEVGDGRVRLFGGSFDYYLEKKQERIRREFEPGERKTSAGSSPREMERERKRREADQRKQKYAEQKKSRQKIERIERKLMPLEEKREELEALLQDPEVISRSSRLVELQKEHAYLCQEIQEYQRMWDRLAEELED